MADKTKNYLWINTKAKSVTYQRNIYKTVKVYGERTHIITEEKFVGAVKIISRLQNVNKKNSNLGQGGQFIQNISSLPFYISKYTLNEIGEGKYCKVIINHYRNNSEMIDVISNNRGTSVRTLMFSYNIDFKASQ
jgi:hypothetical protein